MSLCLGMDQKIELTWSKAEYPPLYLIPDFCENYQKHPTKSLWAC